MQHQHREIIRQRPWTGRRPDASVDALRLATVWCRAGGDDLAQIGDLPLRAIRRLEFERAVAEDIEPASWRDRGLSDRPRTRRQHSDRWRAEPEWRRIRCVRRDEEGGVVTRGAEADRPVGRVIDEIP